MFHVPVHSLEEAVPPVPDEGGRGPVHSGADLAGFCHNKAAWRGCFGADQVSSTSSLDFVAVDPPASPLWVFTCESPEEKQVCLLNR